MFRFSLITVIVAAVALTSPLSGAAAERKAAPLTVAATPKSAPAGYAFTVKAKGRKLPKRCYVVVRVGGSRAKPAERVVLRRGAKVQVRIGGKPGRRTIEIRCGNRRAFSAVTIAKPKRDSADHGELDPSVIPENAETAGPDSGGPAPDLRLPFPCGEDWQSSTYGGHGNALDWNQPGDRDAGRPIVASSAGSVFVAPAGQYNGGYGNYVIVNHGGGWSTLYAHFRGYAVSNGQNVQRGQVLGYVGTTGNSTGNHLHYEQRLNRVAQPVRHSGGGVAAGRTYRSDNCDTSGGAGDPGGPAGQSPSTASFPMRLGVLQTDGKASVKEGGVSTNYTVVAESVKQLEMSGNRVGVVQRDGKAWVKEGGIDATYTLVAENVKQLELSGNRLGVVQNDGKASVKEGPLNATYTLVAENVKQLELSGNRLGVVQNDGKASVKEGPLNATYTLVAENVKQLELSGNRLGVVQNDGKASVKEGPLNATYTLVAENVKQLELSGNRLGVVQNDGKASVKEGPLNATYTLVAENVAQLDMAGTLLGVLQSDGKTWVKQGPLNATYTLVAEAVAQLALLKE